MNYPEIIIFSVRFQTFTDWSKSGEWSKFADGLIEGVQALQAAGADFVVIAANMPHIVFDDVAVKSTVPMLHIADAVADTAKAIGYRKVALMGTIPTMMASFYPKRLEQCGIECITPNPVQQRMIQEVLDQELFRGVISHDSEQQFVGIIESLKGAGAEAVILGCTEIPLLISDQNSPLPVLDSTMLFVQQTLDTALA